MLAVKPIPLETLVQACDRWLQPAAFQDWPGAVNGLQMANPGPVTRLAAAVDATLATVTAAARVRADFLLVHHGLFWGDPRPWIGSRYALVRCLIENRIALYSAHLPLDAHPRWGNNAQLCDALGWKRRQPFFFDHGAFLGWQVVTRLSRVALARRLEQRLGAPARLLPGGPEVCRRIGVVSGAAGEQMALAAQEGVDTFITGEGPHWTYALAAELGLNVFYGGHYATETFGVKAFAARLAARFHLPWEFLDQPTGL